MNTINSVYYGWGFLIVAGAGSYYFAKRSINADRAERQAMENQRRMQRNRQIALQSQLNGAPKTAQIPSTGKPAGSAVTEDHHQTVEVTLDPSHHELTDPAAGGRAPGGLESDNKFEAQRPFRSRKGDRFS